MQYAAQAQCDIITSVPSILANFVFGQTYHGTCLLAWGLTVLSAQIGYISRHNSRKICHVGAGDNTDT